MTERTPAPLLLLALLALACASSPEAADPGPEAVEPQPETASVPDPELPDPEAPSPVTVTKMKSAASATWRAAAHAGRQTGESLGEAWYGMRKGFAEAEQDADFGAFPDGYVNAVRKHFRHFMDVSDDASFRFAQPIRGTMNHGILRGGRVAWRGYLVGVEVEQRAALFGEERNVRSFVVRMRDGEVIEVHRGAEHAFLRRAE